MPPRKRQDPEPEPELLELPLCPQCWPSGWPGDDVAATCQHGEWDRYPAPDPEPTEPPDPANPDGTGGQQSQ